MRKFLVLLTTIILIVGIIGMPMKTAKAVVPASPVPISPVSDFAICSPIPSTVNLSWSSIPGVVYYVVRCSTSPDFSILLYSATTPYNSVPYNFSLGIRYYWDVKVVTSGGESDWSSTATFEILPQPPELINPLGFTPSGGNVFVVRTCFWAPIKIRVFCYPYSYSVFEVTLFPYQAIVIGGNRLEYRFASPYPFATGNYYWEAEVIVGTVESSWSNGYFQIIYPPQTAPVLNFPSNGALIKNLNVNLNWTPVPEATKYELSINGSSIIVNTNSYSLIGTDNTAYNLRIRAGNIAGWGPWSSWYTFRILLPPGTPFLIAPQNGMVIQNSNSALLSWSPISTASSYLVEIRSITETIQIFEVLSPATTLNFIGQWGNTYTWRVKAKNASGESSWSTSGIFTIQENIPPKLEIDNYPQYTNQSTMIITGKAYDLESGLDTLCLGPNSIPVFPDSTFKINFNLNEGPNSFTLIAIDKAGNKTQKTIGIVKDTTPPEINITFPIAPIYPSYEGITVIDDIQIKGSIKDLLPVTLLINNENLSVDSFGNFVYQTNLNYDLNKVYLKVIDAAGNISEKTLIIYKTINPKFIFKINNLKMQVQVINEQGQLDWVQEEIDPGRYTVPLIVKGRVFIPVRKFIELINGTVTWVASERKVIITLPYRSITIELWIGKSLARVTDSYGNQQWIQIEKGDNTVVSFIKNDRSYFPLRFIVEQLNAVVEWDQVLQQVTIEFPIVPVP